MRYEIIDYDVWGNEKDGFEVNQAFYTGHYVDIPENASDAEVVRILKDEGVLKKTVRTSSVGIEGEEGYTLYFTHLPTARPEFELRAKR